MTWDEDKQVFFEKMYRHALITLAWSEAICLPCGEDEVKNHEHTEWEGKPFDDVISWDEVNEENERNEFREQIREFVENNWDDLLFLDPTDVGCNFVLSKNGHGTGFWDRGLGDLGTRLHREAKSYGSSELYFGDDMKVYVSA